MYVKSTFATSLSRSQPSARAPSRGFTLLEIMLALGAIAVIAGGSLVAYHSISERGDAQATVQQVRVLTQTLMQTWGQSGSFSDVSGTSMVANKAVPEGIDTAKGQMVDKWGGAIVL